MARNVVILSVLQHLSAFFFSKFFWFSFIPTPCSSWCPVDPGDVPLNQYQIWDPSTLSKPMNQTFLVRFLIKFLTNCHSFSVSIETSELFSWWLHLSLALFQSVIFSWKEYLEQNVTNGYRKPTDKREKRQRRKNDPFTYLLIVYIIQELEEAIPKETVNFQD